MHLLISVLGNLTMRSVCPAVVQLFSARWSKCPTTSHSKFIRVISQWKCTTLTIVCNWDTGLKSFYYFFFFKATLICILGHLRAVEQCSFGHHQLLRKPSNSLAAKCSTLFTNGVCCCRWCTGGVRRIFFTEQRWWICWEWVNIGKVGAVRNQNTELKVPSVDFFFTFTFSVILFIWALTNVLNAFSSSQF